VTRVTGVVRATVRAPTNQGLHARPASKLVETARRFAAETTLTVGPTRGRAKDLMDVLSLAAGGGAEVEVESTGPDAAEAVAAIVALFAGFAPDD
jgi:phosphocarrier protein HPr